LPIVIGGQERATIKGEEAADIGDSVVALSSGCSDARAIVAENVNSHCADSGKRRADSPEEISAMILGKMKGTVDSYHPIKKEKCWKPLERK